MKLLFLALAAIGATAYDACDGKGEGDTCLPCDPRVVDCKADKALRTCQSGTCALIAPPATLVAEDGGCAYFDMTLGANVVKECQAGLECKKFDGVSMGGGTTKTCQPGTCVVGATRMEDCNTCTCREMAMDPGAATWACTEMACPGGPVDPVDPVDPCKAVACGGVCPTVGSDAGGPSIAVMSYCQVDGTCGMNSKPNCLDCATVKCAACPDGEVLAPVATDCCACGTALGEDEESPASRAQAAASAVLLVAVLLA